MLNSRAFQIAALAWTLVQRYRVSFDVPRTALGVRERIEEEIFSRAAEEGAD